MDNREGPGKLNLLAGGFAVASMSYAAASAEMPLKLRNGFARAGIKEEDLLRMSYPLVHEGTNLNDDVFVSAEMKAGYKSLIGTQLDKDHRFGVDDIVGMHYAAKYDEVDGRGVINADAYVYAGLYPDIAVKISDGAINAVSMETHFEWAERTAMGRVLHGLKFAGAGLVRIPADPDARIKTADKRRAQAIAQVVLAVLKENTTHGK